MQNFKIIVTGQATSGKTALLNRIIHNKFFQLYEPNPGGTYKSKEFDTHKYLEFWDLTYSEKYNQFFSLHYKNKNCLLYCIDLSVTLNRGAIFSTIKQFKVDNPHSSIVLVGTKQDIKDQKTSVKQILQLKTDLLKICGKLDVYLTSSKDNKNIKELTLFLTNTANQTFFIVQDNPFENKNKSLVF